MQEPSWALSLRLALPPGALARRPLPAPANRPKPEGSPGTPHEPEPVLRCPAVALLYSEALLPCRKPAWSLQELPEASQQLQATLEKAQAVELWEKVLPAESLPKEA